MPPSLSYKMETKVEDMIANDAIINDHSSLMEGESVNFKVIRVFVTRQHVSVPVLAATINMPPTEFVT